MVRFDQISRVGGRQGLILWPGTCTPGRMCEDRPARGAARRALSGHEEALRVFTGGPTRRSWNPGAAGSAPGPACSLVRWSQIASDTLTRNHFLGGLSGMKE